MCMTVCDVRDAAHFKPVWPTSTVLALRARLATRCVFHKHCLSEREKNPSKDKDRLQSERKLGGLAFLVVPDGTSDFISPSQPQTESGSNASDKSDKCLISKALITYTGDIIKDLLRVRRQLRKTAVRLFSRKAKLRLLLPVNGVWLSQVTFQ